MQKAGTLIAGVVLMGAGLADAMALQHLGIATDLVLVVAGAGALGVHVNL